MEEIKSIGEILKKHNLTVDLIHNKLMTDRVYKAMQEYADQEVKLYTTSVKNNESVVYIPHCPNKETAKIKCKYFNVTCWLCK